MGYVIKTIRKEVGEVSEEACYHFEVFEDFIAFEKQEEDSLSEVALINTPPVEESEHADQCDEYDGCVTEIIEGEKYRIKGDDMSGHNFGVGDIVEAKENSDEHGFAFCETEEEGCYVHVSEVEPVD